MVSDLQFHFHEEEIVLKPWLNVKRSQGVCLEYPEWHLSAFSPSSGPAVDRSAGGLAPTHPRLWKAGRPSFVGSAIVCFSNWVIDAKT